MNYTLTQLLQAMAEQGASDLHITIKSPPRLRIDGQIVPLQTEPLEAEDTLKLCYSAMTEAQRQRFEANREIDMAFTVNKLARFRANIYMQKHTVAGAFRLIPSEIKTLEEIGAPPVIHDLCLLPKGLVLVTGPTGSGKSTTLAAMVNYINENRREHIITIEDPIEFIHPHKKCLINQREVEEDTKSFSNALKNALRQDPDVVLVGELRDLDAISMAMTAAETGHLVLASLHTNSCIATINRIVDVFPPHQQSQVRTQLSMTLSGVVSQILIPRINGGRAMAVEVMRANAAVSALISEGKVGQVYSSIQTGQDSSGMQTQAQALAHLVRHRVITTEAALKSANHPDEVLELIGAKKQSKHQKMRAG